MITILGAGGAIGNELAALLAGRRQPFRLAGRHPQPVSGGETVAVDVTDLDQTIRAVSGSDVVCLLVGLKYDLRVWQEQWPRVMANAIEACKRVNARLVFFDNVYMYGRVTAPMTENTPYRPCSKKGNVRAAIAASLMEETAAGRLRALIARSADFYGPSTQNGLPNILVFEPFSKGRKASWTVNADVPHSMTFTPDAARALLMLIERETAWNQVWHLPTAPQPPTGRQVITMAAEAMGVAPRFRVLGRGMLRVAGWFNPLVGELNEMLYQYDAPYLFDSSKFAREFGFGGTPYAEGIPMAARSYPMRV
jgi:nucleoside-diphosphate-sugar epimerase